MESNVDVPVGIRADSKPSVETSGGEGATETESHVGGNGSAKGCEEGEEGHGDDNEELPAKRAEEVGDPG